MSGLCDLALAAGLTLSGVCQPGTSAVDPMPPDDPAVWAHRAPAPKEEPPPPPPPAFPPVIIEKTIIREVPVQVPAPEPPGPDAYELAVVATYKMRAAALPGWPEVAVPVSLPGGGNLGPNRQVPAMPLDLGATVGVGGESKYKEEATISSPPVDNSRIVTTDRYISGILETGINTQLDGSTGGPVIIQTTRDVFGYHGRNILIPKGSRLVCAFRSLDKVGSSRAPLRCSRVLAGGHRAEIFGMKANVTDVQGGLGISGEVDSRFAERYGTAFLLAGVSAAVRAASASTGTSTTTSTASATGSTSSFSGNSGILAQGGDELSQRLGQITAATLEQTINLTPILKVAQGTRVQVRPDTDWYITKVE